MKTIKGDLVQLAKQGEFDVIIHGCNCFHTMGAGIAELIASTWPEAYKADIEMSEYADKNKLGDFSYTFEKVTKTKPLLIINGYTQFRPGPGANYKAIKDLFVKLHQELLGANKLRIGFPKIGAGIAGGDWDTIERIINEATQDSIHEWVHVDYVADGTQWVKVI